jgi:hypothetical protein
MYADKFQTALLVLRHPMCVDLRASVVGLSLCLYSRPFVSIRGCFVCGWLRLLGLRVNKRLCCYLHGKNGR